MEPWRVKMGSRRVQIRCRSQGHSVNSKKSLCGPSFAPAFLSWSVQSVAQECLRASQGRPKSAQKGLDGVPRGVPRRPKRPPEAFRRALGGKFGRISSEAFVRTRFERIERLFSMIFDSFAKARTCVSPSKIRCFR